MERLKKEHGSQPPLGSPKIGGPFELVDQHGKTFNFPADLNGAHSLVYFGFTHCPDVCPEELEKISQAIRLIESKVGVGKVIPLFVTCDPDRDTPAAITEYLRDFHPSFIGLTGAPDALKQVAKLFRVYFKPTGTSKDNDYLVDHSIFYFLMDPQGHYALHFGKDATPEQVASDIIERLKPIN